MTWLMAVWFLLGWGFGAGCLTALAIRTARRRLSPEPAALAATVGGALLTFGVSAAMYGYLTDPDVMRAAMGATPSPHPMDPSMGDMPMGEAVPGRRVGLLPLLVPGFYAVVCSVIHELRRRQRLERV
ncbi:hypothetical protein VT50_0217640 [Streptomyces antioxidans]|uniref:Uncharacterized protein n=1 Tax=Streptomyces antioxidans TaxID=1507734 RepID=A0A1V4D3T2_9ACTN|nr:hypothetical protein [Streptomyces antioxidans]OPF78856.1 hypothetical protein VT50_0217640 [Streptomyces antioxidans]